MDGVGAATYRAFRKANGLSVTLIGFIVTLTAFYVSPSTVISLGWVVAGIMVVVVVLTTLFEMLVQARAEAREILPRARSSMSKSFKGEERCLLLATNSPVMGIGMAVSIYQKENDFEIFAGTGVVLNIQENGLLQILVAEPVRGKEDMWTRIAKGETALLPSLLIKPSTQYESVVSGGLHE